VVGPLQKATLTPTPLPKGEGLVGCERWALSPSPTGRGVGVRARPHAVHRVFAPHAATPTVSPANNASSASINAGAYRCANTPGESSRLASSPRQNR